MDPRRSIPRFAAKSFRSSFESRVPSPESRPVPSPESRPPVLLFPDTFTNSFRPEAGLAAADVLESAGFRVAVPRKVLCCGRPLYDYGMLGLARKFLRRVLDGLREEIRSGTPVVVPEPSCAAVFRDELPGLFPGDADAAKLSGQTYVLAEFLRRRAPGYRPPRLERKAILQGHCHQRALMKMTDEEEILREMGVEVAALDSGCCGMAGAFGFEKGEHYDVSMRCGERVLLPEVRRAEPETLIVADGFSCREQIVQATGREALHLAEVLMLAQPGSG
jgi:Fe-S oxidoreductase